MLLESQSREGGLKVKLIPGTLYSLLVIIQLHIWQRGLPHLWLPLGAIGLGNLLEVIRDLILGGCRLAWIGGLRNACLSESSS